MEDKKQIRELKQQVQELQEKVNLLSVNIKPLKDTEIAAGLAAMPKESIFAVFAIVARARADVQRAASEPDCGSAETRAHACGGVYWLERLSDDLLSKYTAAAAKRYEYLLMGKPKI